MQLRQFERSRFFTGQVLTADDLQREQDYHRDKARLHNRFLHGWGVVAGLRVSIDQGVVVVAPGLALDCAGQRTYPTHRGARLAIRLEQNKGVRPFNFTHSWWVGKKSGLFEHPVWPEELPLTEMVKFVAHVSGEPMPCGAYRNWQIQLLCGSA